MTTNEQLELGFKGIQRRPQGGNNDDSHGPGCLVVRGNAPNRGQRHGMARQRTTSGPANLVYQRRFKMNWPPLRLDTRL